MHTYRVRILHPPTMTIETGLVTVNKNVDVDIV